MFKFLTSVFVCAVLLLGDAASSTLIRSSDGTDIYAEAVGKPKNPPIVFVHGFSYSTIVWKDIVNDKRLLNSYYMVSYDLRGHGRSGKPNTTEAYASERFSDDFSAVTKHYNVKSPIYTGWSYGGTVVSDIFTNLPADTLSGVFAVAAVPSLEFLSSAKPLALQIVSGFGITDDVEANINARNTLMEVCFNNVSTIPIQTQWSWLGCSVLLPPPVSTLLIQRTQNATNLFAAGAQGFPYFTIYGTADKILDNDNVTQALRPHFTNLGVHRIQGGSHAMFVDNKDEFIRVLITFADKVFKKTYHDA